MPGNKKLRSNRLQIYQSRRGWSRQRYICKSNSLASKSRSDSSRICGLYTPSFAWLFCLYQSNPAHCIDSHTHVLGDFQTLHLVFRIAFSIIFSKQNMRFNWNLKASWITMTSNESVIYCDIDQSWSSKCLHQRIVWKLLTFVHNFQYFVVFRSKTTNFLIWKFCDVPQTRSVLCFRENWGPWW